VNNFADDTSTEVNVNEDREATTEPGDDFTSHLGGFGLDVHVGTAEKPNSKTAVTRFPCNKNEWLVHALR
jgi:hypothetical protein